MKSRLVLASAHKTRLLLHLLATVHLGYAIYYEYFYAQLPSVAVQLGLLAPVGGKFKYLTFLNGLLQCGYYLLASLHDLLRLQRLQQWRDYLLACLVLPLALTLSVTFWTLCAIDGESIYPYFLELIYPKWLKWTMHCHVAVYALLELCTTAHQYPKRGRGLAGLTAALILYLIWIYFVLFYTGIWIYPFLGALMPATRLCFFAAIILLACGYYLVGERINQVLWTSSRENGH
ncbi:androgen-induced gene 1 protein [Drosophila hydei]|uniref:Androgen-induced gene 1 protein n=1 Tax=Drosophila hydei TaxID=7224 RepID=A0A6J1L6Q3_DROHY|nr:androgen-induced gene 1 protein [Drosophila hydei]